MMYPITSQDVTYQDYPIQYFPAGSSMRETDINEVLDSLFSTLIRQERPKELFFYRTLSPLLEIDSSSVRPRFEIESGTYSIKVIKEVLEKDLYLSRISKIVDKLIEDREALKKVDKTKLVKFFSTIIRESSFEQLRSITHEELSQRIEKIMLIEAITGTLNELSPTQTESFEVAIKRRKFFK